MNYNLCGEFSAAYVAGIPIDKLISDWVNQRAGALQKRAREALSDVRKKQITEMPDIQNMLDQYNCSYQRFLTPLVNNVAGTSLATPYTLKAQIDKGNVLIIGVDVDQHGILDQGNVGHWVVADDIAP